MKRRAGGGESKTKSWTGFLDSRPIVVAVAGPNGAGKTTFYEAHLKAAGLRLLSADVFARELDIDPYQAARIIGDLRQVLVKQRESFVFETVFSDPVGEKLNFLKETSNSGYTVVLCFVGIANPGKSEERVAMRVSQGGHDVPTEKLISRFPRTLANLGKAIRELPHVLVFDNNDLRMPFRRVGVFNNGQTLFLSQRIPRWLSSVLPPRTRS